MPTFRSVKRRHLRRPARWRASCTACDSSIVVVGWTIPEEDGADSRRERLRGAIWFEGSRRFGWNAGTGTGTSHHVHKTNHSSEVRFIHVFRPESTRRTFHERSLGYLQGARILESSYVRIFVRDS